MYEYDAEVVRVVDGDTVDLAVDLGFGVCFGSRGAPVRFRLAGIDAPELSTAAGRATRDRVMELLPVGSRARVYTQRDRTEKYGRWLARVAPLDRAGVPGDDVATVLLREGRARAYDGGKR